MADRVFPEAQHTKHKPGGEKPGYIKSSNSQLGHEDHDNRMPHPFYQGVPNEESGEGQGH
jgi:hypothetical protein